MTIDLQTARITIEVATHLKQQFATRAAHHAELLRRIASQQALS